MQVIYKSYHVITKPQLNLDADCWIPTADISWDDEGRTRHQSVTGLGDYFKIIDQAELNAVEVAMAWIDAELAKDGRR
jgi:hypothetical protein